MKSHWKKMTTEWIAHLTPPCRDITRLLSESMDQPMSRSARLSVRLHLLICAGCAAYKGQLKQIRQALRRSADTTQGESTGSPAPARSAAARLKEAFRQRAKKS